MKFKMRHTLSHRVRRILFVHLFLNKFLHCPKTFIANVMLHFACIGRGGFRIDTQRDQPVGNKFMFFIYAGGNAKPFVCQGDKTGRTYFDSLIQRQYQWNAQPAVFGLKDILFPNNLRKIYCFES